MSRDKQPMGEHPSVRFQNGEIKDFYTAMQVYEDQYRFETEQGKRIYREHGGPYQFVQDQLDQLARVQDEIPQAIAIYEEVMREARKTVAERLRGTGKSSHEEFAQAVERDCYDILAL